MNWIRAVALWLANFFAAIAETRPVPLSVLLDVEARARRIREELWRYKNESSPVYRDRNTKEAYDIAGGILDAIEADYLRAPYKRKGAA